LVFHFNKGHLADPNIPMWVVKTKGESWYVDHVECSVAWSTKETPDNNHTKGSIKVKRCLLTINDANCATVTELTDADAERLKTQKKTIRIITEYGKKLRDFLKDRTHGEIKMFGGGCSTAWFVTELYSNNVLLLAEIAVPDVRVLMPNEHYYKQYDKVDSDDDEWDEEDWDDFYED